MELINVELYLNKTPNAIDFIYVWFAKMDKIYAAMDDSDPSNTNFERGKLDELLQGQLLDQLGDEIHREIKERGSEFQINDDGMLVRSGDDGVQIVSPHSFNEQIFKSTIKYFKPVTRVTANSTT